MKRNIINKDIFDKEISVCQKMNEENGGCAWGRCESCGVIPFAYKLHKGKIIDKKEDIKKLKNTILNNK